MNKNVYTSSAQLLFACNKPWKTLLDCACFVKTFYTILEKYIAKQERYSKKPRTHFYTNALPAQKSRLRIGSKPNSQTQWAVIPLKGISNIINH